MASLNIPPVDPYTVERHSFHVSRNDGVHVSGTTRKVKVYGASKGVIQSVRLVTKLQNILRELAE